MAPRADNDLDDWDERLGLAPLARAALWGGFAVLAACAAVLAARSDVGSQRIAAALGASPVEAQAVAEQPISALDELRLLTATVRVLTADRERLLARLDALERSVEHTGSVPAGAAAAPSSSQAATANAVESGRLPAGMRLTRTEFGLDLGSERSLEMLRGLWMMVKAQHGAVLEDLQPVVAIRDHSGGEPEVRLVAGPLANAADAARLCAVIGATGRACRPAPFEGQRLALR